jgi:hypothetical protein
MTRSSIRKPTESVRSRTPLWNKNLLPLELEEPNNVLSSYSTIEKIYLVHCPSKIQLHSPTVQSERHTYSHPSHATSFGWRKY